MRSFPSKFSVAVSLFFAVSCLVLGNGCSEKKEMPPMPPRPVQTAVAIQKDVPFYIESFGSLAALVNVDIKSQVTGKILQAHFKQGQRVAEGDLLFTIDPAEYKASLDKAQAVVRADDGRIVGWRVENRTASTRH